MWGTIAHEYEARNMRTRRRRGAKENRSALVRQEHQENEPSQIAFDSQDNDTISERNFL
jgi:hypothetical protein